MTRAYNSVPTDPGTGPNKVDVATAMIGGKEAQIVGIDIGEDENPKPLGATNPMPVKAMPSDSTVAAVIAQGVQTVAAPGTPEALTDAVTLVESVLIQAAKGFNSANTSPVFVGSASGDNANFLRLRPWETLRLTAPRGEKIDLHQLFIDVIAAGDGVTFLSIN